MFSSWCNTWGNTWYCGESVSRKSQLQAKLRFLRSTRDDLETKLAATNAAIEQIERQVSREERAV
jgi:hypothetical protein